MNILQNWWYNFGWMNWIGILMTKSEWWFEICRRGISRFYNYKSKSFTSLAEAASSSSIKEIVKPENAYTRKRRNLLASNLMSRNSSLGVCSGGISKSSKRTITASQSTLALAVAMCSAETSPSTSGDSNTSSLLTPPSFNKLGDHAAWRSLSLADLQECATSAAVNTTSRFFPSKPNLQQWLGRDACFSCHQASFALELCEVVSDLILV